MPPDRFLSALLGRVDDRREAGLRLGTVSAIDAADGSLTVDLPADGEGMPGEDGVVPGMRWVASYSPVVGDLVVVSRVGAMWVVLGKLSKQLGAPNVVYGETTLQPQQITGVYRWAPTDWGIWSAWDTFNQGRGSGNQGTGAIWWYPSIAAELPAGATITGARLRLNRVENWEGNSGAQLVRPRLYAHTVTGPNAISPTAGPSWHAGPWSPGTMSIGQTATWELPSDWVAAWIAGTVKGFGVWSTSTSDWAIFGPTPENVWPARITVDYTVPA